MYAIILLFAAQKIVYFLPLPLPHPTLPTPYIFLGFLGNVQLVHTYIFRFHFQLIFEYK